MSTRAAGRLAWSAWGACVALTIAECVLVALNFGTPGLNNVGALDTILNILFSIAFLAFPTVGALVASRYPRNAIGWIFLAVGLTLTVSFVANEYGIRALIGDPGSLPGGEVIAWLSTWLILPGLILATTFLLLLFPNGTLPSRRWRPVAWLIVSSVAALTVAIATTPGPLSEAPFTSIENPFGLEGHRAMLHVLTSILFPVVLTSCVAAAAALLLRFRRARGEERAQLKWIAFAGALLVPSFIATGVLHEPAVTVAQVVTLVLVTCLPVAAGIAILKYRLYEIDRVISKTLVYGALTVVLGAAYVGLVLAGQTLFSSFAGGSNLAIAVSTLVVAALFLPMRSRVQRLVDRRFNRRRYDAQRTLETFGARLREQIDLGTLEHDLQGVVTDTMQPAHTSVWLRKAWL